MANLCVFRPVQASEITRPGSIYFLTVDRTFIVYFIYCTHRIICNFSGRTLDLGHCCMGVIYLHSYAFVAIVSQYRFNCNSQRLAFLFVFLCLCRLELSAIACISTACKERNLHCLFNLSVSLSSFIALLA